MTIRSPGEILTALARRIPKRQRLAFVSTFVTGFLCHLFIFTNSMYNNDDIRYLYVDFDKPELGRWLQTYAAGISSYFSLPVVNGILALIYGGVAAMIITHLLDIRSRINIVLTGAMLITFPTMACLYSYMFAADPFILSCALSCGAAWFVVKGRGRFDFLAGSALMCLGMAIYQAYLPFTLLLMLICYVLMLCDPSIDNSTLIRKGIQYIIMLAVGLIAYFTGMMATLRLKNTALSDYQGVGESSLPTPAQLIVRMRTALSDFVAFFGKSQVLSLNKWLLAGTLITVIIIISCFFIIAVDSGFFKSPQRMLLCLFTAFCVPFAANVIYLISEGVSYHMLMRHGWCLLFIGALAFGERGASVLKGGNPQAVIRWLCLIGVGLTVWNYIILSNIGYFNMNFRYEKTYALCLKIVNRLEQSEDYDRHRPMAFVGNYSKTYRMDELDILLDPMTGMKGARVFGGSSRAYLPFFQNCLGEDIEVVDREVEEAFLADPRFIEMPRFPAEGSIRVIDDITVIKLND